MLALPAAGAEEFPASIATPGWTLQDVLLDPVSCGSILSTQLQLQPFSFLSQKLVGFVTSCDGLIEKRRNSNRQTGLPKNEKTSLRFQLIKHLTLGRPRGPSSSHIARAPTTVPMSRSEIPCPPQGQPRSSVHGPRNGRMFTGAHRPPGVVGAGAAKQQRWVD